MLNMDLVGPNYFAALGVRIIRGRGFTASDRQGAPAVAVISESAARHYWPGADPIGKHLLMGSSAGSRVTVVGVVPDTRYRNLRDARPSIYFPLRQSFFPYAPTNLVIRTSGRPSALIPGIRRAIDAVDPGIAVENAAPLETFRDEPLAQPRLNALLLGVFAGAAVLLAAVGLFAIMATMVRERTRELGIRMALGATATDMQRLILRRGVAIAALGTALGLAGASLGDRLLTSMLYEVSPTDAVTLTTVGVILLVTAAVASAIPARSSTQVDPVSALRAET